MMAYQVDHYGARRITAVARVALSALAFFIERDYVYAGLTLFVLLVLLCGRIGARL